MVKGVAIVFYMNTKFMLMQSSNIPIFSSISDFSNLIGLSESLLFCLSTKTENYYQTFKIPKRNGSLRTIQAPSYTLRIVQRWILQNILYMVKPSPQTMAFRPGSDFGCKSNALIHQNTNYGVAIDLSDFFTSIKSHRVFNVFSNMGYSSLASAILTNLTTLNGHLPQGAICSPALSNLVCLRLDSRINGLCEKRRIRYSRYADDLYFSGDDQDRLKKTLPIVYKIITEEEFSINKNKTHFHTPSNRKIITGIIIHKSNKTCTPQLKTGQVIKRKIRSELFKAIVSGDYSEKTHILGEIAYVNQIEPGYKEKIRKYILSLGEKISIFPELVDAYNKSRFFQDLPILSLLEVESLLTSESDPSYIDYLQYQVNERRAFLSKHSLEDICDYCAFQGMSKSEISLLQDECPF